jgi:caffeoyl-CoA O-methyltransferase
MTYSMLTLDDDLVDYFRAVSLREPAVLRRLRDETAPLPRSQMQISPEEGQFFTLLIELIGAKKALEIGTFTGYSALAVARALPADGTLLCCDVSEEWTSIARRYWAEAGVADKIDLRLAPAAQTLQTLLDDGQAGTFDFAFVDADKTEYDTYYELTLQLLRRGGLMAIDNVLSYGRVAKPAYQDPSLQAIRALNEKLRDDERVTISLLPFADGITLALKR